MMAHDDDDDPQQPPQQPPLNDITVVIEESSPEDNNDEDSQSSEEFNFAVALALRKNLTETFDKHVHSSSVSDKIARFETRNHQNGKPPPVAAATASALSSSVTTIQNLPPRPVRPPATQATPLAVYLRVRPLSAAAATTSQQQQGMSENPNRLETLEILPPSSHTTTTNSSNHPTTVATTVRTFPPLDSHTAKVVRTDHHLTTTTTGGGIKDFQFHQVFGPSETQQDVYNTVASPLVGGLFGKPQQGTAATTCTPSLGESALLFAYGITNAGKTYTMLGGKQSSQQWGIIPRALQDIFAHMEGCDAYDLQLSYLEIYNEQIYDLLPRPPTTNGSHSGAAAAVRGPTPLRLRESREGVAFVRGLTKHRVRSVAHGLDLADRAKKQRHTSSNNINQASSRSHCICQLDIVLASTDKEQASSQQQVQKGGGGYSTEEEAARQETKRKVTLWVVDLAGSERSKRTGTLQGSLRQKEASIINASLMKLMRCLSVMRENQSHKHSGTSSMIPFRESKLTHLFMNHLTGPSANRTSMIVNINPAASDFDETQHVLSYAVAAKTVQISQEDFKKRKQFGDHLEATHDANGRAIKKARPNHEEAGAAAKKKGGSSKIAKLVKKFSPKRFSPSWNAKNIAVKQSAADARKAKAEIKGRNHGGGVESSLFKSSSSFKFKSSHHHSSKGEPKRKMPRYGLQPRPPIEKSSKSKQTSGTSADTEKEIKSLKTALCVAKAEAAVLQSEKKDLQEELDRQESNIRMEIAQEMEEQMASTREHYNTIIERLKLQIKSNPEPAKSVRKAKLDKVEQHIEELVDKVDECEEEMVRMREEHVEEVAKLHEHHEKAMDAKEKEIASLKEGYEISRRSLQGKVDTMTKQLSTSRSEYEQLRKSKEEMMESYERIIREEEEEHSSDEEEESEDDEEEEENDKTPKVERHGGTQRFSRKRVSKVACEPPPENLPQSSAKKSGGNRRMTRSSRVPFASVLNKPLFDANPASDSSDDEDSFGVEKWLKPNKPVQKDASGEFLRPRGRAPSGREWDARVGAWRLAQVERM